MAVLDYLRLFRLPNVFTAVADVWAGFLLTRGGIDGSSWGILAALSVASGLLYTAGMVLNDVFDVEVDSRERPERPLPSGRISLRLAAGLGALMLILGVGAAWAAPLCGAPGPVQPLAPAVVALLLAGAVLAYDSWAKRNWSGPLVMGVCRGLNLLLGMVAVGPLDGASLGGSWLGLPPLYYLLPLGAMLYITGLTWFARDEAELSRRSSLVAAFGLLLTGLALVGIFPLAEPSVLKVGSLTLWLVLYGLLAASVARPFVNAIRTPEPGPVQAAIKHGILSLITLDAVIAFYGADHPAAPLAVIALLLPSRLLGRWVYST